MKEKHTVPPKKQTEMQERQQKSFELEVCRKESQIALSMDEDAQNQAGESAEKQANRVSLKTHAETQIHNYKSFELQVSRKERQAAPLMMHIEGQNQLSESTKLHEENTNEPRTVALLPQTAKQKQLPKTPKLPKKTMKENPSSLSKSRAETKLLRRANEFWAKSLKRMAEAQTPFPLEKAKKQKSSELRETLSTPENAKKQKRTQFQEKRTEETQEAIIDEPEEEIIPTSSGVQVWTKRKKETWRAADTTKGESQNPPRKTSESKVDPATAALRKQFADIQNRISPAKPATPKIRWTPNLSIPPPDRSDLPYAPPEILTSEGVSSTLPKISETEVRKWKREKKKREREEMELDEVLDTEVVPSLEPRKLRRGERRLNELEEAMKIAGMYPEDPDRKTEEKGKGRERGRGRGRGGRGNGERPWEETETTGRGRGRGRGRAGRFV